MKKAIYLLIIFLFSCNLGYKLGGEEGYSKSLQESKNRNSFIKSLQFKITPEKMKSKIKLNFFIERAFNYGDKSIFETKIIEGNYQLVFSRCNIPCEEKKDCNYNCKEKSNRINDTIILLKNSSSSRLNLDNSFLRDTVTYDLIYNYKVGNMIKRVDTIGEIKVWDSSVLPHSR